MSKTKIENGYIKYSVHISDLLKSLSEDELDDLVEDLSCEDRIIKNVSDQIIYGCTERGWHGGKTFSAEPSTALDKAIRAVAENATDVSKKEIDRLKRKAKQKEEQNNELWDRVHELERQIRG